MPTIPKLPRSPASRPSRAALALAGLMILTARAADEPAKSGWNFQLMPKAFQRDPRMEMTVFSDMTEAGRKLPAVSREAPAYYVAHSGGYHAVGDKAGDVPLAADEVTRLLRDALSKRGYEPATPEHPPTLFITYTWGPHMYPSEATETNQDAVLQNVLDRAALAGGEKFAAELAHAVSDRVSNYETMPSHVGAGLSAASALPEMNAVMDPVKLLADKSSTNLFLISQAGDDCYYVVASAYGYQSVAENHRQLLWRTRMTVNARAVSQSQAIPTLIVAATPFFGRETTESAVLTMRVSDVGRVEIGESKVVDPLVPPTKPPEVKK